MDNLFIFISLLLLFFAISLIFIKLTTETSECSECEGYNNYLLYRWPQCTLAGCRHRGVEKYGLQSGLSPFRMWTFNNRGSIAQNHYNDAPVATRVVNKHW